MLAIRVPCSALGGVVLSVALFLGLWQLVDVPIVAGERLPQVTPELAKVRPPTTVETKREKKVERDPPVLPPGPPKGTHRDDVVVDATPYGTPPITVVDYRDGPNVRGIDGDVRPVVRQDPAYPPRALASGTEGWVQVQFSVTAIGAVRDAVVVASEPGTIFDDAALKAIARWRYNPRVENGEAVERVGLQTVIRFELEN
jgi:periplasmic protein TonB